MRRPIGSSMSAPASTSSEIFLAMAWPRSFFRIFLPTLVDAGTISPEDAQAFDRAWDEREHDPSAFVFLPPMVDVIGVTSLKRFDTDIFLPGVQSIQAPNVTQVVDYLRQ